ncbi:hypothetical protein [Rothia sp. (in: high G+C Gram-positive bacteria)]|uniref:hypothetical protein n=1 Tax=Rothia sp. (in: high G+C Gram-positive bacteria) TaxID=1885016 RepID=UPI000ED556A5|nr:hypothetical protein [Rothia sp. (in: high G+C Gram-positive bacteria)]
MVTQLNWFPKEFRAGDADGKINESLMGKPELSPLEVLIRETAQNSWDARILGAVPKFEISLRSLHGGQLDLLRLLPINQDDHEFIQALDTDFLDVIEISDRRTTGLDGPVDMSPTSDPSVPKNFENLIYKVGVPRHDGKGGGTYGFGKTATYSFSRIGTVIFWTRCRNEAGELEDRFIASAFRPQYSDGNRQYTGRHWWGERRENHIYPLRNEQAQQLGEMLFESRFVGDETGTSLLILAPKLDALDEVPLSGEDVEEEEETHASLSADEGLKLSQNQVKFLNLTQQAIREHLWPKLIEDPHTGASPMDISLKAYGSQIDLFEENDRFLKLWGSTLNFIRAAEEHVDRPPAINELLASTQVKAVTWHQRVIGYLGITQFVKTDLDSPTDILNPSRPGPQQVGRIALMREQTELVVNTVNWFELPENNLDWIAVYRSVADFDALYAESEPPAHDSWNSKTERREVRLLVERTKRKVVDLLHSALAPENQASTIGSTNIARTTKVASRFARLLPVAKIESNEGTNGRVALTQRKRKGQSQQVRLSVQGQSFVQTNGLSQQQRVTFAVEGTSPLAAVRLSVAIVGEDSAIEQLDFQQLNPVWEGVSSYTEEGVPQYVLPGSGAVQFSAPARVALRVNLVAEEGAEN